MNLFEQLKELPKVDMHINLTSSISTDLAAYLMDDENLIDIIDKMQEKNVMDYENSLKLPIKILKSSKNLTLAINDLIDNLEKNNVIYTELFLDLPLYNKRLNEEKTIETILNVIKTRNYHMNIVLVLSSEREKEDNLKTLSLFEKYYQNGVNGIYFKKDKMTNLDSYSYLFDRLIKNNYPYILNMNSKMTNTDREIYLNAKRIIYSLPSLDELLLNDIKEHNIMLEFGITRFRENNLIDDFKNYFIYNLVKDNYLIDIASFDMTTLNIDILNEWCVLFNNYPFTLHDIVKIMINCVVKANINDDIKNNLIDKIKEKANLML